MIGHKLIGSKAGLRKPWLGDRARLLIASLLALVLTGKTVITAKAVTPLRRHGKDFITLSDNGLLEKDAAAAVAKRADFTVALKTGMLANSRRRLWGRLMPTTSSGSGCAREGKQSPS